MSYPSLKFPICGSVALCIIPGIPLAVGQSVEHPLCRFPADLSVRSQVPHCIARLLEFVQDLGDEGLKIIVCASVASGMR
jgi:hypothetical protein